MIMACKTNDHGIWLDLSGTLAMNGRAGVWMSVSSAVSFYVTEAYAGLVRFANHIRVRVYLMLDGGCVPSGLSMLSRFMLFRGYIHTAVVDMMCKRRGYFIFGSMVGSDCNTPL